MIGNIPAQKRCCIISVWKNRIPENHLLRLSTSTSASRLGGSASKDSYSETGRPLIDPELLLHILLIGYLYDITSERKLVEELRMHLAWRWFTGLSFDQEIPHHSTFSNNRHRRFPANRNDSSSYLSRSVRQCVEVCVVQGKHLSVDRSFVEAMPRRKAAFHGSS